MAYLKTFKKKSFTIISLFFILLAFLFQLNIYNASDGDSSDGLNSATDLVTPALDGVITYSESLVYDILDHIVNSFANQFSPTSDYLYSQLLTSRNSSLFDFFYTLGYVITIAVFAISMFIVCMGGVFENKNNVIELLIRFILGIFMVAVSRKVLDFIADYAQKLYDLLLSSLDSFSYTDVEYSNTSTITAAGTIGIILLGVILIIAFIVEFVKFLLEMMEKYIITEVLKIASPAVSGLITSRTTSSIFVNFYRMYFSQLVLMLLDLFFLKLTIRLNEFAFQTFMGALFIIAFVKTAQRLDQYMKSLGLTVAQTGASFMGALIAGAGTLMGLSRVGKGAAGFVGAAQMRAGAEAGDFGLFKAGAKKAQIGRSGIAGALTPLDEGATLRQFAASGGGSAITNGIASPKDKKALTSAITNAYKNGDYQAMLSFNSEAQTSAAREILGANGAFKAATGFDAGNITQASFNKFGEITGKVKVGSMKGADGKEKAITSDFRVSSSPINGKSGIIDCSDGQTRNIQAAGSIDNMSNYGSYEFTEGGISNLSTISGIPLDDDRLAALGASNYMYDASDNMLYIADNDGNVVYQRGLDTGNEIYAGDQRGVPEITDSDFQIDGRLYDYAPQGYSELKSIPDRNSVHITTNPKGTNDSGDSIWVTAPRGKITQDPGRETYRFDGYKIPLNDRKTKIISDGRNGSYAVYGKNRDNNRKIRPQ